MTERKKILVMLKLQGGYVDRLREVFPHVDVVRCEDPAHVDDEIRDSHVVLGKPTHEQFLKADKLEFIQVLSASVTAVLFPELTERGVRVANGKGLWSVAMAEHVLALILAFYRDLPALFRHQRAHHWAHGELHCRTLHGATVGFVGTGDIARETVRVLWPFGCRILGYNRRGRTSDWFKTVFTGGELMPMVSQCDVVVNSLPSTPPTQGLIDARVIGCMKRDALFINVGRGATVDEAALADALRGRRIAGAALDVLQNEPPADDNPLWDLENVVITPHTSSEGTDTRDRPFALIKENLQRYLNGQPLVNEVDVEAGY